MQLESHSTPNVETPEQRYATLHRAIERGLASDEVWKELAEVSVRLGHTDEAVGCLQQIKGETMRRLLESRLRRLGLVEAAGDHSMAPAADDAGKADNKDHDQVRLGDHVVDALHYLTHQHMPWLVLVTTLAFPLVVGVGGMLTAGKSPWLLAAIAALPGLCVLALVGVMGRQILLASSEGNGDVPPVPPFGDLLDDARRFVVDAALVLGSMIVPSLVAMALGAPISTTLPGLAIGMFFTPLMWALRQVRGDRAALSPITIMRAIARTGGSYVGIAVVACLLFAPAIGVTCLIFGRALWVQIAMIGPLCVVPMFVASRLLGTWLDARRRELSGLLTPAALAVPKAKAPAAPAIAVANPRLPRRPEALENFMAPVAQRKREVAAHAAAPAAQVRPAGARPAARPAPTRPPVRSDARCAAPKAESPRPKGGLRSTAPAVASRGPRAMAPRQQDVPEQAARATSPRPPKPATPARSPASPPVARKPATEVRRPEVRRPEVAPSTTRPEPLAIEGRGPQRKPAEGPDLAHMPGALVVSSAERARLGAAAKKR